MTKATINIYGRFSYTLQQELNENQKKVLEMEDDEAYDELVNELINNAFDSLDKTKIYFDIDDADVEFDN